jgi:LysM repeat protein
MAKNAPAYGLDQIVPDEALEYDTIRTTSPTNMALIGDMADMPLPQLLQLNPALLRSTAPGNFEIRVPKGTGEQLTSSLQAIPAERLASSRMHKVASGDSLASIARQFNASSSQIASANNLSAEAELNPGDQLLIPAAWREPAAASRIPTRTAPRSSGTRASVRKGSVVSAQAASHAPATRQVATAKPAPHRTAGTIAQLHHPQPMSR